MKFISSILFFTVNLTVLNVYANLNIQNMRLFSIYLLK